MVDDSSYGARDLMDTLPGPTRRFREGLAHHVSEFIREGKFESLGPSSAISPEARKSLETCINQCIKGYMDDYLLPSYDMPYEYHDYDPGEERSTQFPTGPACFTEFSQNSFTTVQSATWLHEPSSCGPLYPTELPSTGSGYHAAGNDTVSTNSHFVSIQTGTMETEALDEGSSAISARARVEATKAGFKHECKQCGERFQYPAKLKSHKETASHSPRRYCCEDCNKWFTRNSSRKRHKVKRTCKGTWQANGAPTSGPSPGVRTSSRVRAAPSETHYISGSSADPVLGSRQPSSNLYPPSPTSPQQEYIDPKMLAK